MDTIYETKKTELIAKMTELKKQIHKPCCKPDGDVRGMCFTCIGDISEMPFHELIRVSKCPMLEYAFAYWVYNNYQVTTMSEFDDCMNSDKYLSRFVDMMDQYFRPDFIKDVWHCIHEIISDEEEEERCTECRSDDIHEYDPNGNAFCEECWEKTAHCDKCDSTDALKVTESGDGVYCEKCWS